MNSNSNPNNIMIQAIVTNTKSIISSSTGEDMFLHDLFTLNGEMIQVWASSSKPLANVNEEVYVVSKNEEYNGKTRTVWSIIPTAFAEKVLANTK